MASGIQARMEAPEKSTDASTVVCPGKNSKQGEVYFHGSFSRQLHFGLVYCGWALCATSNRRERVFHFDNDGRILLASVRHRPHKWRHSSSSR